MKIQTNLFIFLILSFLSKIITAQNLPQGISYQAVAIKKEAVKLAGENLSYVYWANQEINVRFSIYATYPNGTVEYAEKHSTKTDDYGVFNLVIGKGDILSGKFETINWELGDAHLMVEIDFDLNGNFELIGVQKFWSVPYAFVSKKQSLTNSKNDSLINDLLGKYDYLKKRDQDTVIGNEGGVSYKYLDSLNSVLLDSIGKLHRLVHLDKDTTIGNEWQDLYRSSDSLLISNGKGIKLLDDDSINELQDIYIKNDSLFLTQSKSSIALKVFRDSTLKSNFSSAGDSSFYYQLLKSPYAKPGCLTKSSNHFNLGVVTVKTIAEFQDSIYYFGSYQITNSPFTKGEFIVSKSKKDCGTKLIFKTQNTRYFNNVDGTGISIHLGSNNGKVAFLSSDRNTTDIIQVNLPKLSISKALLKTPLTSTQPYTGFEKNITNLLCWHFYKDTIYLIYNNLITKSSGTYNGPNRLYKFNSNDGSLVHVDSLSDYTSFGTGSSFNGFVQFYDSLLIKSNPIKQEIAFYNLMSLKSQVVWTNSEGFSTNYMKNLTSELQFRYFPNAELLFIPSVSYSQSDAIVYSLKNKKTIFDNSYFKYTQFELLLSLGASRREMGANKKYIEFYNDWNSPFYYLEDPEVLYFK